MINKIKDFFNLNRTETIGLSVFMVLILLIGIGSLTLPVIIKDYKSDFTKARQMAALLEQKQIKSKHSREEAYKERAYEYREYTLFYFDPNKIGREDWQKLGMPEYRINRIMKYREKGGKFRKSEDIGKFTGNDQDLYSRLLPYIKIEVEEKVYLRKERETSIVKVEVNTATAEEFMEIKGIGQVLSDRIIKYRERLGGFCNVSQIAGVYGIDSLKYEQIKDCLYLNEGYELQQVPINLASFRALASHPLIGKEKAAKILDYRRHQGSMKDLDELMTNGIFETDEFYKVLPYLKLWDE